MGVTNFDERAKDWDSDPMKVERARVVADAIRAAIPLTLQTRALEYGCGTGLLGFALQPYLASITLADTSQGMLDVLTQKIRAACVTNMYPVCLNLITDPLPAARYQVICSLMTLHHIHDTDAILRKFHKLLEPGGHLCIADLEKEDGSFHDASITDVHHGFDRGQLCALAEGAGFQNVNFSHVYAIQKAKSSFPLFLMIAGKDVER